MVNWNFFSILYNKRKEKSTYWYDKNFELIKQLNQNRKLPAEELRTNKLWPKDVNPMMSLPAVTGSDDPRPLFHFWPHHLWPKFASFKLKFCRWKRFLFLMIPRSGWLAQRSLKHAYLSRLELIWLISRLKISNVQWVKGNVMIIVPFLSQK